MDRTEVQYTSLKVERPVIETQSLRRFMAAADYAGYLVFTSDETALVPDFDKIADEEFGQNSLYRTIGVARHKLYDSEELKLPLLDKRSPQSMYKPLSRANDKLMWSPDFLNTTARYKNRQQNISKPPVFDWRKELRQVALAHDIPRPEELNVSFDHLSYQTNPGNEYRGREIALTPDIFTAEALLLIDEATICFNALSEINKDLAYPANKTSPQVAFVRLPKDANDEQVIQYCAMIQKRLPINLTLGGPHASPL